MPLFSLEELTNAAALVKLPPTLAAPDDWLRLAGNL